MVALDTQSEESQFLTGSSLDKYMKLSVSAEENIGTITYEAQALHENELVFEVTLIAQLSDQSTQVQTSWNVTFEKLMSAVVDNQAPYFLIKVEESYYRHKPNNETDSIQSILIGGATDFEQDTIIYQL